MDGRFHVPSKALVGEERARVAWQVTIIGLPHACRRCSRMNVNWPSHSLGAFENWPKTRIIEEQTIDRPADKSATKRQVGDSAFKLIGRSLRATQWKMRETTESLWMCRNEVLELVVIRTRKLRPIISLPTIRSCTHC